MYQHGRAGAWGKVWLKCTFNGLKAPLSIFQRMPREPNCVGSMRQGIRGTESKAVFSLVALVFLLMDFKKFIQFDNRVTASRWAGQDKRYPK